MVAFNLPRNSRIGLGQTFKAPAGAKRVREFKIYRWNPDDGKNPRTGHLRDRSRRTAGRWSWTP